MDIQYGKRVQEEVYTAGKLSTIKRVEIREPVANDSEELAMFIRFQKDSKGSQKASFTKELRISNGKTNRYIVREWEV